MVGDYAPLVARNCAWALVPLGFGDPVFFHDLLDGDVTSVPCSLLDVDRKF